MGGATTCLRARHSAATTRRPPSPLGRTPYDPKTPRHLRGCTSAREWGHGHIVVDASYDTPGVVEQYFDLVPALEDLYVDADRLLSPIQDARISHAWRQTHGRGRGRDRGRARIHPAQRRHFRSQPPTTRTGPASTRLRASCSTRAWTTPSRPSWATSSIAIESTWGSRPPRHPGTFPQGLRPPPLFHDEAHRGETHARTSDSRLTKGVRRGSL